MLFYLRTSLRSTLLLKLFAILAMALLLIELFIERPASAAKTTVANPILTVHVGVERDFAPYSVVTSDGNPSGFAIDLLRAVARQTDLKLEFHEGTWQQVRRSVEAGKIDMVALMAKSTDRAELVDFSDTHINAFDSIFINSDNETIHSQDDLAHKHIIVEAGDLAEEYLQSKHFPASITAVKSPSEALKLLSTHQADAVICSQVVGLYTISEEKIKSIKLASLPHFGGYEREFAFAVRKGDHELLHRLNDGLKSVIASGEYGAIYEKWFSHIDPELKRQEEGHRRLLITVLLAVLVALVSTGLVLVFKREVNHKTRSLAESEKHFRSFVENLPGIVFRCVKNPIWRVDYISDAIEKITGYPAADFILPQTRTMASLVHPEDRELYQSTKEKYFKEAGRFEADFRVITKDGQVRWLHARGVSIKEEKSQISRLDGIFLDITEQKRVSNLLTQQQSKMASSARLSALGEMAGGIAHEINNPLAIIHLRTHQLAQKASKGPVMPEDALAIANGIETTSIRISKIIKSLQTVARESERDPFELVTLSSIIGDAFELCYQRMRKNGIVVTIADFPENLEIECKRVQISQVLINLLNNAFDAVINERVREIHVSIREVSIENRDYVEIAIVDNGKPIPVELAQKIFQPFFTTKGVGKGTGLGLSISKGIIEAHDGSITLDTEFENTRFVILLPKFQPPQKTQAPLSATSSLSGLTPQAPQIENELRSAHLDLNSEL